MKKLLFLLSLVIAVTASALVNAQERIGTYTFCGIENSVLFNQEEKSVYIDVYAKENTLIINLEGQDAIESFRKSLIKMKEEYALNAGNTRIALGTYRMSTSFEKFAVYWSSSSNKETMLGGVCESFHPDFLVTRNKRTNEIDFVAAISQRVKDIMQGRGSYTTLFVAFQSKNEIQSLIDVISLCLERLSTPSSSQRSIAENSQKTAAKAQLGQCPPGAVDLGLRTQDGKRIYWASCNLGASSPEEYGDYFSWGELEAKTGDLRYNSDNYKWTYDIRMQSYAKYNDTDNKMVLDSEDDAAQMKLGGNWHVPTWEEYQALINNYLLTREWTTLNGVSGFKITSHIQGYEGNWIFLPAAGYKTHDLVKDLSEAKDVGLEGTYWTSNLVKFKDMVKVIHFNDKIFDEYTDFSRFLGVPIRPVYTE